MTAWAGSEPQEPDVDLDDVPRAELGEGSLGDMPVVVAVALDAWAADQFGVRHDAGDPRHGVGVFLDELAAAGYRVTPIPVSDLCSLLPPATD